MHRTGILAGLLLLGCSSAGKTPREPMVLHVSADLSVGETQDVPLMGDRPVRVKLLDLQESLDDVNGAVRVAKVRVEIDGRELTLTSGTYHLPVTVGSVQVDCPITKGYIEKGSRKNIWGLLKDARLRVWPAGSPWIPPGTFQYPARQRWFASFTHMANEPVYVDGGDLPGKKQIYYHYGLDIGGSEGLVDVVAATDGLVVSSGKEVLEGPGQEQPVEPRYDVIYLLDARGWYYRYSHLKYIEAPVRPGARVAMGQKLGVIGKEGGSGGWTHLHLDITRRQPSGLWGIEDGYAFLWQTSLEEHPRALTAVARPHSLIWAGESADLDGSQSQGRDLRYEWILSDGSDLSGLAAFRKTYPKPGSYCEILKVTDVEGHVDYDFKVVQVLDKEHPDAPPPTTHATYAPTFGIRPDDPVVFKVRTFRDKEGGETWDFGDGTPPISVKSDGNRDMHAADGYAETIHKYKTPGHYLVSVEHRNAAGVPATARLQVRVGLD
ncbi:MAG TPA: PKD domain-containing protein [Planctomycetota bacterium]|nr:PKD domain-containing protein [Planctomycetota bacterium]